MTDSKHTISPDPVLHLHHASLTSRTKNTTTHRLNRTRFTLGEWQESRSERCHIRIILMWSCNIHVNHHHHHLMVHGRRKKHLRASLCLLTSTQQRPGYSTQRSIHARSVGALLGESEVGVRKTMGFLWEVFSVPDRPLVSEWCRTHVTSLP